MCSLSFSTRRPEAFWFRFWRLGLQTLDLAFFCFSLSGFWRPAITIYPKNVPWSIWYGYGWGFCNAINVSWIKKTTPGCHVTLRKLGSAPPSLHSYTLPPNSRVAELQLETVWSQQRGRLGPEDLGKAGGCWLWDVFHYFRSYNSI